MHDRSHTPTGPGGTQSWWSSPWWSSPWPWFLRCFGFLFFLVGDFVPLAHGETATCRAQSSLLQMHLMDGMTLIRRRWMQMAHN